MAPGGGAAGRGVPGFREPLIMPLYGGTNSFYENYITERGVEWGFKHSFNF